MTLNTPVLDHLLSHDEYFAIEREDDHRYEYVAGKIFAMTGGTERHALISANTLTVLANSLRDKPCRVYGADMKLFIENHNKFCYPDVMVLCEKGIRHDLHVENPLLIVEVLSDGPENYDRGLKFEHYRSIAILQYYVLINQNRMHVEWFERDSGLDPIWRLHECNGPQGEVVLDHIDVKLILDEIYRMFSDLPRKRKAE